MSDHVSGKLRHDEIQGAIVHEYDGIEEADNDLPRWWVWVFMGCIGFAVLYWFYYHEYNVGDLPMKTYAAELAKAAEEGGQVSEELLTAMASDKDAVGKGKVLFASQCAVCHKAQGEGDIGPNLTDEYWIHGESAIAIYTTIDKGVAGKSMPPWGPTLGSKGVQQLTVFLLSIKNTNIPGKDPEGIKAGSNSGS